MNGADAIVFAGGIGENSAEIRSRICSELTWLGTGVDEAKNTDLSKGREGVFSTDRSKVKLWVIPTNEELLIARDAVRLVNGVI